MDAKPDQATLHYFMYRRVQQEMQLHLYHQNHHHLPPPPLLPPNYYAAPSVYAGLSAEFFKSGAAPRDAISRDGQLALHEQGRITIWVLGLSFQKNVLVPSSACFDRRTLANKIRTFPRL